MATTRKDSEKPIKDEEEWAVIQEAVDRIVRFVEGIDKQGPTPEEYMRCYTAVYNICQPNPTGHSCQQLYDHYKNIFENYINSRVIPSLREKKEETLLRELAQRWTDHKTMNRWLWRYFHYLDRYFVPIRRLPTLQEAAFTTFYGLVYGEMNHQVRNALLSMIKREREGEQIDGELVKKVLAIYVEIGMGSSEFYEQDFEEAMLEDTAAFYSEKSSIWIKSMPYQDYLLKVENCLKHERETVSSYLQGRNPKKLLEIVEQELQQKKLPGELPSTKD